MLNYYCRCLIIMLFTFTFYNNKLYTCWIVFNEYLNCNLQFQVYYLQVYNVYILDISNILDTDVFVFRFLDRIIRIRMHPINSDTDVKFNIHSYTDTNLDVDENFWIRIRILTNSLRIRSVYTPSCKYYEKHLKRQSN